jgi:hypothetical protein
MPVSREAIRAAKWQLELHMRLARGGVFFQYRCIEHPRLRVAKSRAKAGEPMRVVFDVDGNECADLADAIARLNGAEVAAPEPPPAIRAEGLWHEDPANVHPPPMVGIGEMPK